MAKTATKKRSVKPTPLVRTLHAPLDALTREQWLTRGVAAIRPWFEARGYPVPHVRVSVGFPRSARKAVGQCWKQACAADGVSQIFITPQEASGVEALDTLAHEMLHAAIDPHSGHNGAFITARKAVGLTAGKPTSASAGPELRAELERIATDLGKYPHAALTPSTVTKQTTRLRKVACDACGYTVRVTRKWLDAAGAPLCPCSSEAMTISEGE